MSGDMMIFASFMICLLVVTIVLLYVIRRQQKQIDALTDRLMARSYTEYKTVQGVKEDDVSPKHEDDEPKGWYDQ